MKQNSNFSNNQIQSHRIRKAHLVFSFFLTFLLILISICLLIRNIVEHTSSSSETLTSKQCKGLFPFINTNLVINSTPLSLTPYVKGSQMAKARELSYVGRWKGVSSYSAFFTVNETYNSNLFFWFFPCEDSARISSAPLILYLQGGPSLSSMLGLFWENGPFKVIEEEGLPYNRLMTNQYSWTKTHSMLYIDNPVESGYSFTSSKDAYAKNQDDIGRDLYEALLQFFQVFPEFRTVDFYVVGTSYAAKYVPTISYKIHMENTNLATPADNFIKLKGLGIGSGYFYFPALIDGDISEFYYNIGMLDHKQRERYENEERKHKTFYENGDFKEARKVLKTRGLLTSFNGFSNFLGGSALELIQPALAFQKFLNHPCIQSALHVGINSSFATVNYAVFEAISDLDYVATPQHEIETLLNDTVHKYRVLVYNSQFDVVIPHTTVAKFIYNLTWNGYDKFAKADRGIWRVSDENDIAGFATESPVKVGQEGSRLTMVLIRNAGHAACYEQPAWCLDMIGRFTRGTSFLHSNSSSNTRKRQRYPTNTIKKCR